MLRLFIAGFLIAQSFVVSAQPVSAPKPFACQGRMFEENLVDDKQLFVPQVLYFQIAKDGELWFGAQNAEILSRSSYQTWRTKYIKDNGAHYYIARGGGVGLKGPLQNQKFSGNAYLTVKKNGAEASVMIEASVAGTLKKFAFVSSSCSY